MAAALSLDDFDSDCYVDLDDFDSDFYVDPSEYSEYRDYYDALVADLDDRWQVHEQLQRSRRLRRDPRLKEAVERLRVALNDLWLFDDGHSDEGYEGPNLAEWETFLPVADDYLRAARLAFAATIALTDLRRALSRADLIAAVGPRWIASPEPRTRPPSRVRRSEPDLALAPPLFRVALQSDDVIAAAA
jgi:hypothetical protein